MGRVKIYVENNNVKDYARYKLLPVIDHCEGICDKSSKKRCHIKNVTPFVSIGKEIYL